MKALATLASLTMATAVIGLASHSFAQNGPSPGTPSTKRPKIHPRAPTSLSAPMQPAPIGSPLIGLGASDLAAFNAGREEFVAIETPQGGLGPIFNDNSCAACHFAGGIGGASNHKVVRFGRLTNGQFDALANLGGSLLQARAIDRTLLEHIPAQANVVAMRITTPLFGAGLIEAIPDETILLNAQRSKPDGVKGRASMVTDPASGQTRVGRFGWKAQQATLLSFAGDAYLNEMGITNRLFPIENAPNGRTDLIAPFVSHSGIEDTVDPTTGKSDIDTTADFMRFLAPPQPAPLTAQTIAGAKQFDRVNCTACHTPNMSTGASRFEPLSYKTVNLYSDLLLHDMGTLGDGITQNTANGREMRTAPLWGLRFRNAYLHDGRAMTLRRAILSHDGEAAPSRQRFQTLTPMEQQQLLDFLKSI